MPFRILLIPAAAAMFGSAFAAGAQQTSRDEAEKAADRAVAEARAEVVAEAQAQAADDAGEATLVTITDFREGSSVRDTQGGLVGTIDSVDENGAVVSTGRVKARLPFSSFGKNARGLVISLTRAQLEAEVQARTPS